MVDLIAAAQLGVALLAVALTGYFTLAVWRRRSAPTARPLLAFAALLLVGSVGFVALVHAAPVRRQLPAAGSAATGAPLWFALLIGVVLISGGFWFLFTLEYTGRGGRLRPITAAGVVGYWLVVATAAVFGDFSPDSTVPAESSAELVLFVGGYLMSVLMIVGAVLILTTSLQRNAVGLGEAVALAGGGVLVAFIPVATSTLKLATTVPVMLSLAGCAFLVAIARYPAFEAPPVARITGRDRLIEEMNDPFVVVDGNDIVRDLNPAGERAFDTSSETVRGEPLEALLPSPLDPERVAESREPVHIRTSSAATLACDANRITDQRDRFFGHILVFRDVTDRQRRERRLSVLNQLLTGAVSERMGAVADSVTPVATPVDDAPSDQADASDIGSHVRTETTRLLDLVTWAREIERSLARESLARGAVMAAVRDAAATVTDDEPLDVTISVETDASVPMDQRLLETVFEMLLTDAADGNPGTVRVEGGDTEEGPVVHIVASEWSSDRSEAVDEPLPATEDRSRSTVLVEIARQAMQHYGGQVTVETTSAGARRTTVELPATPGGPETRDPSFPATDSTTPPTAEPGEVEER
jgi:uncharacterized membrane protein YjfL (UPF0719 family)